MTEKTLLDTGVLVASINARDPQHSKCRDALVSFRGLLVTTEGVLTEATWMLRRAPGGAVKAVQWFRAANPLVVALDDSRLQRTAELMQKYRDVPMDFVDATLVTIAEIGEISRILTLDRRGFETYRMEGAVPFTIVP